MMVGVRWIDMGEYGWAWTNVSEYGRVTSAACDSCGLTAFNMLLRNAVALILGLSHISAAIAAEETPPCRTERDGSVYDLTSLQAE